MPRCFVCAATVQCGCNHWCHLYCQGYWNACPSEAHLLMQLQYLNLHHNQLEGALPETWDNLTSASPSIDLTCCCYWINSLIQTEECWLHVHYNDLGIANNFTSAKIAVHPACKPNITMVTH